MFRKALLVQTFLFIIVALFSMTIYAGVTDDLTPCVVFLIQVVPDGNEANIGSGFLVNKNDKPFLVTAAHVANSLRTDFKLIMPGKDGKAVEGEIKGPKWIISPTSDVAVLLLYTGDTEEDKRLLKRCIPSSFLEARPLPPSRDIPLIVMGYPLGLGVRGYVSPLSLETKAASGFITMPRFDNKEMATVILLQDPGTAGLSGGPVFDTGATLINGRAITVREGVSIVGIVHGVISDKTGGKYTAVVPSTEIVATLGLAVAEKTNVVR